MNKVILIGNLTKKPELSTTPNNISVCKFTVAVQRRFKKDECDFLPIICWRGVAENCGKYLKKGSKVGISGAIQTRNYDAKDGTKRYVTEIIADEVDFLSSKNSVEQTEPAPTEKPSKLTPMEDVELPF